MLDKLKRIPESQGAVQRVGEWAIRQRTFMPRMIDLELSRVCNLNCPACMRRAESSLAQSRKEESYCSLERFRAIHRQIPTIQTLNFMGDGEPTMNPAMPDILEYAASKGICTVVTTNTTLVDEQAVRHWERNRVYRVHASVDSADKATYEACRVGAEFERTMHNLRLLGRSSIPLCLNAVLTEELMPGMPDMVWLAHDVGAREITFLMPICSYGPDIGGGPTTRPLLTKRNQDLFDETHKLCRQLGIKWIFPLTLQPTWRRFNFPFIRPQIALDGDVWACCYSLGRGVYWYMGKEYHIRPGEYIMGNMFTEGFRNIWYGSDYRRLRELYQATEIPKGSVVSREELSRRTDEVMADGIRPRFEHCKVCQARWGMACS